MTKKIFESHFGNYSYMKIFIGGTVETIEVTRTKYEECYKTSADGKDENLRENIISAYRSLANPFILCKNYE